MEDEAQLPTELECRPAQKSSIPAGSLTFHTKSKQRVKQGSRVNASGCVHLCERVHSADPPSLKISFWYMCERQRHAFDTYSWSLGVVCGVCFDLSVYLPPELTAAQHSLVILFVYNCSIPLPDLFKRINWNLRLPEFIYRCWNL